MSIIGTLLIRSAILSSLFLLLRLAFRSASLRSLISRTGLVLLLALPVLTLATPRLHVPVPRGWTASLPSPISPRSTPAVKESTHQRAAETPRDFPLTSVAVAIYALIAAVMFVRLVISISRLSLLSARATPVSDPRWMSALSTARAKLGFTRPVRIVRSVSLHSPMTWGALRPLILLDAPTLQNAEGAEAILLHELTHIGRGDWLFTILGRLLIAMQWLNPFTVLLVRAAQTDAERVCDDEVLLTGASPLSYASLLLAFASRESVSTQLPVCAAVRTPEIRNRIQAVLDPNRRRGRASLRVVMFLIAAFVGIALLISSAEPSLLAATIMNKGERPGDAAARALDEIDSRHTHDLARAMRLEDYSERRRGGRSTFRIQAAIDPLLLALSDSRPVIRRLAVWGLSEMRYRSTIAPLRSMLTDRDADVRAAAARALGDIGDRSIVPDLLPMMDDPESIVRAEVAHALGDLRDGRSESALRSHLDDPSPEVRDAAAWGIHELIDP